MIVSTQPNLFSKEIHQQEISIPGLFRGLEKMHKERLKSKDDLSSFNLVEFRETKREVDIVSISGQILDFDGCEAPISEVLEYFKEYTFVAYSSFNNGIKGKGARFRLILPFDDPISGFDYIAQKNIYEHIFDVFAAQIEHLPSGLDTSKRNPGAFYKRPCMTDHPIFITNSARPLQWQSFIESEASVALARRKQAIALNQVAQKEERARKAAEAPQKLTPAQKAKAAENSLNKFGYAGAGTGNVQFFKYAKSLAGKGFEEGEVEYLLNENADKFGNKAERKKEIAHILSGVFK